MRWFLPWLLGLLLASCTPSGVDFVAWPDLPADSLSFAVSERSTQFVVFGPFETEGPKERLQVEDVDSMHLIAFDRQWLRSRHPRVDPDALMRTALVPRPEECALCSSLCRTDSNEEIFLPVGDAGLTWTLDGGAFQPSNSAPLGALSIRLPAKWVCTERRTEAPFERLGQWPSSGRRALLELGPGRYLVLGLVLELIGGAPEQTWTDPEGRTFHNAAILDRDRVLVTASHGSSDPSVIHEFDVADGRLTLVRTLPFAISVNGIHIDERGVLVSAQSGEVATSTDAVNFQVHPLATGSRLGVIKYIEGAEDPYLIGGNAGVVLEGDPWNPGHVWKHAAVAALDSSIGTIEHLVASDTAPSETWARSLERGIFSRRSGDDTWSELEIEMRTTHSICTLSRNDSCGFTLLRQHSEGLAVVGRRAALTLRDCPALAYVRKDDGCASTVELRSEHGLESEPFAVLIAGDHAIVAIADGLLRVPLDGL